MATESVKKAAPSWSDVKTKLADFDRVGMLALVHDMYAANKDNQAFLHARFGLGADTLKPYKTNISRGQDTSISKAKKAIVDYKKAIGRPEDLAELMTYYCEQAAGFSNDVGLADEGYFDSLVRMFAQVLKLAEGLPTAQEDAVLDRLGQVRRISHNFGYGVGDEMDELLEGYQLQD